MIVRKSAWTKLPVLLGTLCLAAACSSGGGSSATDNGATATDQATTAPASTAPASTAGGSTSSPDAGGDRAAAAAINLTQPDLAGWTSTPADNSQDPVGAQLAKCAGAPDPTTVQVVDVNSPNFDQSNSEVSSNVTTVKTAADGQADLKAFEGDKLSGCVQQVLAPTLQKSLPSGATISGINFSRLAAPAGIPDSFAIRVLIAVNVPGSGSVNVTSDMLGALVGRAEIGLTDTGSNSTPDASLESKLINLLVGRAHAQTGLS